MHFLSACKGLCLLSQEKLSTLTHSITWTVPHVVWDWSPLLLPKPAPPLTPDNCSRDSRSSLPPLHCQLPASCWLSTHTCCYFSILKKKSLLPPLTDPIFLYYLTAKLRTELSMPIASSCPLACFAASLKKAFTEWILLWLLWELRMPLRPLSQQMALRPHLS